MSQKKTKKKYLPRKNGKKEVFGAALWKSPVFWVFILIAFVMLVAIS